MMKIGMRVKKTIKIFLAVQLAILLLWLYSFTVFINFELAFISSVLILLGSTYSYKRLVDSRVASEDRPDDTDVIEKLDDPYDLYSEEIVNEVKEGEAVDLKEVVKEERARLKANKNTIKNTAKSAPALISIFRVVPYVILVLSFIGLKNNGLLNLPPFLIGLGVGIVVGFFMGRALFAQEDITEA